MASKADKTKGETSRRRGARATDEKPVIEKEKRSAAKPATPRRRAAAKAEGAAESTASAKSAAAGKGAETGKTRKTTAKAASGASGKASAARKAAPASRNSAKSASDSAAGKAKAKASPARKRATAATSDAKPTPTRRKTSRATAKAPEKAAATDSHDPTATMTDVASTRASDTGAAAEAPADSGGDNEAVFARMMSSETVTKTAQEMAQNLERIEALGQRLAQALSGRKMPNPSVEMPGPDLYMTAAGAWMKTLTDQPARMIEQQVNFWGETLKHYARAQTALVRGGTPDDEDEPPRDKRFSNPMWRSHPFFSFVRRQYEINANAMSSAVSELDLPDETARRRVNWLTSQIIDMMAPTNFLATNPDALEKAVETEGQSLVKGLENLVRDVELNGGEMLVSLADRDAFTVGDNIGTSEGTVVHRTPLYEMIQYKPTTDEVHEVPLIIFPPWINKFYILDLKPQNSLIRWLVGQGYTLFVISWKNPDASYADVGIDHYVAAYLDAIEKVLTLTDAKKLNAVGYCIAGTTLSLALALMARKKDDRVNSATFFTTLTDFSDQGEFTTFLQDDFVDGIEKQVTSDGILKSQIMSRTMSFLRANDLVWGPAIRSYMMGETPPAFDLLYWNGDSTNLPARMTVEYLRGLCQKNAFAGEGFEVLGETVRLSDVTLPLCSVACETDHIAPWKDCWRGVAQMGSDDKRFILSESGHIAGIVNPPTKKKYGHYSGGTDFEHGFQSWKDSAEFVEGSWWPLWDAWLAERSGGKVPARDPGQGYGPAPGVYVHEKGGLKNEA